MFVCSLSRTCQKGAVTPGMQTTVLLSTPSHPRPHPLPPPFLRCNLSSQRCMFGANVIENHRLSNQAGTINPTLKVTESLAPRLSGRCIHVCLQSMYVCIYHACFQISSVESCCRQMFAVFPLTLRRPTTYAWITAWPYVDAGV